MNTKDRMLGLAAAIAGCPVDQLAPTAIYTVTRRADYRQAFRPQMLTDARRHLLRLAGAPDRVIDRLGNQPISEWPPAARSTITRRVGVTVPA